MIWRENRLLLTILALLLLANAVFFFTYRVQYESRLRALDARLQGAEDQLQRARNKRMSAEQQLASYRKVQTDLQTLYNSRWATEAQRLTALIHEVKRLGTTTQLDPNTMNFTRVQDRELQRSGGIGTATVVITFSVHGSYQQIRRLINLLELSNQFVIIDAINLATGGTSDTNLTLNLRLKTVFRDATRSTMMINKEM
jgi:F0F1-type ATP synthase membrane subunit b/b'